MPSNRSSEVFAAIALVILVVTAWALGTEDPSATDRLVQAYQSRGLVR